MTELVIQGIGGRMGHVLCDMIAQRGRLQGDRRHRTCTPANRTGSPSMPAPDDLVGRGDVIIDFSSPAAVEKILPYCEAHKTPIVPVHHRYVGRTEPQDRPACPAACPVFKSANMSLGINLLIEAVQAGFRHSGHSLRRRDRGAAPHHNKVDAPSGTALMLADAVNEQAGGAYHYVYDRASVREKRRPHGDRDQLGARRQHRGRPRGAVLRAGRSDHPQAHRLFPQRVRQRRHQRRPLPRQEGGRACTT